MIGALWVDIGKKAGRHGQVISEEPGGFRRVGGATSVAEEREVIDLAQFIIAQANQFTQTQAEQARGQHHFHRMAKAEVGGEGEGHGELGQAQLGLRGGHGAIIRGGGNTN